MSSLDSGDCHLDILGQQPLLKIYTQVCSIYAVRDVSSHAEIINNLTRGLERLAAGFPWTAGQITQEGAREGYSGVFKFTPFESTPRLVVKDLTRDVSVASLNALRTNDFSMSMLDEGVFCPRPTLPKGDEVDWPAFLVQATFIPGGLVLSFVGHHQAMDMTGQGRVISLLDKACRGEVFTAEERSVGNLDRKDIIPLFGDEYSEGPELDNQTLTPTLEGLVSGSPPPAKCRWVSFSFPPTSLKALKSLATASLPSSTGFVSTDDALTAFILQATARARRPRFPSSSTTFTFARAVDARRFLNIPAAYPGLVQNMTYHTFPLDQLATAPLGVVAANLRGALDPATSDVAFRTRALATSIHRSAEKTGKSFVARLDLNRDVMLSSWAKEDFSRLDFGLGLGAPEAVRRPSFAPLESLMYLLPRSGDGEITAVMCLRHEDLATFRADAEVVKYGKFVG